MESRGFTLIELLVVIAIIGVLSTIVLSSFTTARMKARDAARKSFAHQIQVSLELYNNANGMYPQPNPDGSGISVVGISDTGPLTLNALLVPNYFSSTILYDQTNIADAAYFSVTSQPDSYVLHLTFEQSECKTGVGPLVGSAYPSIPVCQ